MVSIVVLELSEHVVEVLVLLDVGAEEGLEVVVQLLEKTEFVLQVWEKMEFVLQMLVKEFVL